MIDRVSYILLAVAFLTNAGGCQFTWRNQEARYVDPVLRSDMNRQQLVGYLNGQTQGLEGWQCNSTVMSVRLPNGLRGRLEGVIACQSPRYFRLTAESFYADADLGSNASRCWMYVRPGDPAVLTWKHEDTALLQQMPTGMPYIDPNWLMLVLGIKPLNADDYELSGGPSGTQEYWLTAVENSPHGRPLRRVIKVDRVRGVVREHAVYDSEAHPIVRATLKQHRSCDGHVIPTNVKLEFPQMDSEITLTFRSIETNPHLPDELWHVPDRNIQVVDLGNVIRQRMGSQYYHDSDSAQITAESPSARLQPPEFDATRTAFGSPDAMFDGSDTPVPDFDEPGIGPGVSPPDWDQPISFSRNQDADTFPETTAPKPKRRSIWSFWRR